MPSLRELQVGFAAALFDADGGRPPFATVPDGSAGERMAVYRRALFTNYRNALGASFPVVSKLVGAPFFHAAVDAFVRDHPPTSGDLNVYGDAFAAFLEGYPHATGLPYLADVARLEWAQDEANRAADADDLPERVLAALAALAPERLPGARLVLAPSCRLVASRFPILRIWQANQEGYAGEVRVSLDEGGDALLIRRELAGVTIERLASAVYAWLEALASGTPLGAALEAAQATGAPFDLATLLRARLGDGTIAGVSTS
jgi:hypothetical protein